LNAWAEVFVAFKWQGFAFSSMLDALVGGDFDTRSPQPILPAVLLLSLKSVSSYQFLESATSSSLDPVIVFLRTPRTWVPAYDFDTLPFVFIPAFNSRGSSVLILAAPVSRSTTVYPRKPGNRAKDLEPYCRSFLFPRAVIQPILSPHKNRGIFGLELVLVAPP
jgi:hypothetical protein